MARKKIPVVGTKQLHLAQLSPEARRILHHRAMSAARREYAPALAADREAFGVANQAYRTQAQSVRGATGMVEGALTQALKGLKGSGLSGGYLKQVQHELTARQADAASAVPFLLSDAASERSKAIREARTGLIGDRAEMKKSGLSAFNQLLKEERGNASEALKKHEEKNPTSELKSDPRSLKIALNAVMTSYRELLKDSGKWVKKGEEVEPGTEGGTEIHPPRTDLEWRTFAERVNPEGADPLDVLNAVNILRERVNKQVKKGNLRPLRIIMHPGTVSG